MLLRIKDIHTKLSNLIFIDDFNNRVSVVEKQITIMRTACEEILTSDKLKKIFTVVLAAGNFLNYGTSHGRAHAIHQTAFAKMFQFRSTTNSKFTFVNFIVSYVEKNFEECMDVGDQLKNLEIASKFQPELCRSELNALKKGFKDIENQISLYDEQEDDHPQYWKQIQEFISTTTTITEGINQKFDDFEVFGQELLHTFGLPEENMKPLTDIFVQIHGFTSKFRELALSRTEEQAERRKEKEWNNYWFGADEFESDEVTLKAKERRKQERDAASKPNLLDTLIYTALQGNFPLDLGEIDKQFLQIYPGVTPHVTDKTESKTPEKDSQPQAPSDTKEPPKSQSTPEPQIPSQSPISSESQNPTEESQLTPDHSIDLIEIPPKDTSESQPLELDLIEIPPKEDN